MPHERGLKPLLPTEFFCTSLADPKARFCAARLTLTNPSTETLRILLTLGNLHLARYPPTELLEPLQPGERNRTLPLISKRVTQLAPRQAKTGRGRKDAQRVS